MQIRAVSSGFASHETQAVGDRLTPWRKRGLAVLAGLLLALGQAPFSLPYGVVIALPVLAALLLRARGHRQAFAVGWFAGVAYFAGSMFWIVEPFFVEPERYGWMSPFAILFLSTGLALFWGLGFGVAGSVKGGWRLLVLVLAWTAAEGIRSFIFTGFPWGLLAYIWAETPIFQALVWYGPHGLGAVTVLLGVLPLLIKPRLLGAGLMIVFFAGLWAVGSVRVPTEPAALSETTVRMVQPNAPQHLKWHPDHVAKFFQRGLELSGGDGAQVDLILWPETSVPFQWEDHQEATDALRKAMKGTQFIGGINRDDDLRRFNSLIHLDTTGELVATYDKYHLVPFGEYIPFGAFAAKLGISGMAAQDGVGFSAGSGQKIISVPGVPAYLPLICYEAIFPKLAQSNSMRPDWLLHLTNDAWFGNFSGPYQHLAQARARAIEQGLPVVRVANTGVSGMIDPYGRLVVHIPLNSAGFLDATLPVPLVQTSNLKIWMWIIVICLFTVVAVLHKVAIKD